MEFETWGSVIATAFHDPKELSNLFKAAPSERDQDSEDDSGGWDNEDWWEPEDGEEGSVEE